MWAVPALLPILHGSAAHAEAFPELRCGFAEPPPQLSDVYQHSAIIREERMKRYQSHIHPAVKETARGRLSNAVAAGRIRKPERCQRCGSSGRLDGHHPDYMRPLDVEWLCRACHQDAHRRAEKSDDAPTVIDPPSTGTRLGRPRKPGGRRYILVTLRLHYDEYDRLVAAARAHSTTVSAWLREAGQRYRKA